MAYRIFDNDLRLMAKKANERMRQLEKQGINSPAYQAVQARLEQLGRHTDSAQGRRFSESGKGTRNEILQQKKALSDFLNQRTSTLSGAKQYRKDVLASADKNYNYKEAGLSDADWLNIWADLDDYEDIPYGSDQIIAIVETYTEKANSKNKRTRQKYQKNISEIIDTIQSAKNFQDALKKLNLSIKDIEKWTRKDEGF